MSFLSSRLVFVALTMVISAFQVMAQYSVSLPYHDVTVNTVNGVASFKGTPVSGEPGQPLLPVYTVTFLIPSNTDYSSVNVTFENLTEKEFDGTFEVTPALPPTTRGEIVWPTDRTIVDEKDMGVYGQNAFFPAETKGKIHFGGMRNYKLAEITVHPCRYNPVTRKLRIITGGTIVVTVPSSGAATQLMPLPATTESDVEKWLRNNVVNPQALQGYGVQTTNSLSPQSMSAAATKETYAVITTNAILRGSTQLSNLLMLKYMKGFNVITLTEDTWGGGVGDVAANNIRNWLRNNYIAQNIKYVLLIGNPDPLTGDVPMKMCWPRLKETEFREAPTDFYYAELRGNWDINNDGFFGDFDDYTMVGGPDRNADVAVGRIPYYGSLTTLDKIISKIFHYENETATEWRRNAMLPMEPTDKYTPGYHLGEAIRRDFLIPKSMSSYRLYDAYNTYNDSILVGVLALNPPAESPECSESRVLNAWKNNDFGLVIWHTHGWQRGAEGVFSSENAADLDGQHPSIVFEASCDNAYPEDPNNLAYSLLANGAVATIAATRSAFPLLFGDTVYAGSLDDMGMAYSFAQNLIRDDMGVAKALYQLNTTRPVDQGHWWMNRLVFNVYGCPDEALNLKPIISVAAPTGLSTTMSRFSSRIDLSWSDQSNNETGFRIERAPYNGGFTEIVTVGANVNSYIDDGLSAGKQYQYRVRAFTSTSNSLFSNIASSFTYGSTLYPPTSVAANATSPRNVEVSWNAATGADSYNIWISFTNSGPYALVYSGETSTTYNFTSTPGKTYYFVVTSVSPDGESSYSSQASIVAPLISPINLVATVWSSNEIKLEWYYDETDFFKARELSTEIEYATTGAFTLFETDYCHTGDNRFYASGLNSETTYKFRVRAKKGTLYSNYSNIVTAIIPDPYAGIQGGGSGLQGTVFGLTPSWAAGTEYCKATDGNTSTFYDYSQANGGYTGLDLPSPKIIGMIKYYPRSGFGSRMVGGKFQGSNTSNTSGFVDLYTISSAPADQWTTVTISDPTAYRWVRYLGPDGSYGNIAEMEFYQVQRPHFGPHNITNGATLQIEDYDYSEEGISNSDEGITYHDNDAVNHGGAYRLYSGVDMETSTTGLMTNVGWTEAGEWMEYTCNVTAGTYNITLYAASPNTGTQLVKLYQDNVLKATFTVPNTGGWQTYQPITVNGVALSSGSASVLKLETTTGGYNLNKLTFAPSTGSTFEAENLSYTSSIAVDFAEDQFVRFRSGAATGAWMQFNLPSIPQGTYAVTVYYKSNSYSGIFQAAIDGNNQGGTCDEYLSTITYAKPFDAGTVTFGSTATHTMKFTVTGKNALSYDYDMSIDMITFTPISSTFPDPTKWYKIATKANTNLCLDVTGGNYANSTAIELWTKSNVNQEFQFKDVGNGYYTITCRNNTNYSIDMGGTFANSQTLKLWTTDVNNANQKFKPVPITGGYYRLETSNSSFSIDNWGAGGNGVKPALWTSDNNNVNQQWVITAVP